jgi:hypothetical protein
VACYGVHVTAEENNWFAFADDADDVADGISMPTSKPSFFISVAKKLAMSCSLPGAVDAK